MNRDEAIAMLKRGLNGVREWNERRLKGECAQDLHGIDLRGADLRHVDFRSADPRGPELGDAARSGADVSSIVACGPVLIDSDLRCANLSGANLRGTTLSGANLDGADLSGADLSCAKLDDGKLNGADLSHANLDRVNLRGASLKAAKLDHADLSGGVILTGADLSRAHLSGTIFSDAHFDAAKLSGAITVGTKFVNVDLSRTEGLEEVVHFGPCSLGIDTLYMSHGRIPKVFLRGCGVPEELIAYLPSLLGAKQAIEFYSCFISYSHQDEEFCKRLHSRMRDEHLRVWFAPEDMKSGKKIHEQIDAAIGLHDKLLLVLSEESMTSKWVKTEIRHARKREHREEKRILFPIRLVPFECIQEWTLFDADVGDDSAAEIREYYIPDFSNWKDSDAFETAFQKLLGDLKDASDNPERER